MPNGDFACNALYWELKIQLLALSKYVLMQKSALVCLLGRKQSLSDFAYVWCEKQKLFCMLTVPNSDPSLTGSNVVTSKMA